MFMPRMLVKDASLSRKEGWTRYSNNSWILLPKVYGSKLYSMVFYSILIVFTCACFTNGGVENDSSEMWIRDVFSYICNGIGTKSTENVHIIGKLS